MHNYTDFYRVTGINKPELLLQPRIIKADTFVFPNDSIVYWYKVTDHPEFLDTNIIYLNKAKKIISTPRLQYSRNYKDNKTTENTDIDIKELLKEQEKKGKKIKFTKPDLPGKFNNELMVYHYGLINHIHDFSSYPFLEQNKAKYNAVIFTLLDDVNNNPRFNNYITIDIGRNLPKFSLFNVYATKGMNATDYMKLEDERLPCLVDVFNIFYNIGPYVNYLKPELRNKTTLLFTYIDKCIQVNVQFLFDLIDPNVFKCTPEIATKLLYVMVHQLINGKTVDIKKLTEEETFEKTFITKELKKHKKLIDLNEALDEYIIDTDSDVEVVDLDTEIDESYTIANIEVQEAALDASLSRTYETLDNLYKASVETCFKDNPFAELDYLKERKAISPAHYKKYKTLYDGQFKLKDPYGTGRTIYDILKYDVSKFKITDNETKVNKSVILFNERYNTEITKNLNKKYIREQYHEDLIKCIYSINNLNHVIDDYHIEKQIDILGGMETHVISILGLSGKKSTFKIALPIINEDGTFKIYGNTYLLRKQRTDLPIRKILNTKVELNTYYGKIFIEKAVNRMFNVSRWFEKTMTNLQETDKKLKAVVLSGITIPDVKLPLLYCQIAREVKSFRYDQYEFTFAFKSRFDLNPSLDRNVIFDMEDKGYVLTGRLVDDIENLLFMDFDSNIHIYNVKTKKLTLVDNFFNILGIDDTTKPIEFCSIRLLKETIPVVILLSYYLGLENLLKMLKVNYQIIPNKTRTSLDSNQYSVRFSDSLLVINKDNGLGDIILGGLLGNAKTMKYIKYSDMNTRKSFSTVFTQLFPNLKSTVRYTTEVDMLEKMFIDPMTLNVLKYLKYPETFPGMIIKASELLLTDTYRHPNNLDEMIIKGYERIAGIVYNTIVKAMKDYTNKSAFSKAVIELDEYEILRRINEDNTKVMVDDLNPVAYIKQAEDLTLLGMGGRAKETMVKRTREYHDTEIGIVSEATKDSTDVGITAYLSAAPQINNTLGVVTESKDRNNDWNNILSTCGMLAPFGLNDDAKRLNFASIMASHIIPMTDARPPYILTGYETMVALKTHDKFAVTAEDDGVVLEVTNSKIVVEYKNKKKATYKLYSWTTKEESGSCYTVNVIANLTVGQKFLKDDTITYAKEFFEPCIFEPRRVIYKQGINVNCMFAETIETYEDSTCISEDLHKRLNTKVTKIRSIIIDGTDHINNLVQIGDKVLPDTVLLTFTSGDLIRSIDGLDKESLEILNDIKQASPKSKYKGVISKIECYYNFDPKEASKSIKSLIEYSDGILMKKYGATGKVTSNYSVEGKPLIAGEIQIKIYIEIENSMANGDKLIYGNQLKCTIGNVFDYEIISEDNEKIDAMFSNKAIAARITNSPYLTGTTGTILKHLEDEMIRIYFGK